MPSSARADAFAQLHALAGRVVDGARDPVRAVAARRCPACRRRRAARRTPPGSSAPRCIRAGRPRRSCTGSRVRTGPVAPSRSDLADLAAHRIVAGLERAEDRIARSSSPARSARDCHAASSPVSTLISRPAAIVAVAHRQDGERPRPVRIGRDRPRHPPHRVVAGRAGEGRSAGQSGGAARQIGFWAGSRRSSGPRTS